MTGHDSTPREDVEALNDRLAREHPIDEYYDAFKVSESDAMWLEPASRVAIW